MNRKHRVEQIVSLNSRQITAITFLMFIISAIISATVVYATTTERSQQQARDIESLKVEVKELGKTTIVADKDITLIKDDLREIKGDVKQLIKETRPLK